MQLHPFNTGWKSLNPKPPDDLVCRNVSAPQRGVLLPPDSTHTHLPPPIQRHPPTPTPPLSLHLLRRKSPISCSLHDNHDCTEGARKGCNMDQISIKTPHPKCRLYWCLIEFIDWRYRQSCWYFRPLLWTSATLTFSWFANPPPPPPFPSMCE